MADTDIDFDLLTKAGEPAISFKAGDVIFREGDPAIELFAVKNGAAEIRIRDRLIANDCRLALSYHLTGHYEITGCTRGSVILAAARSHFSALCRQPPILSSFGSPDLHRPSVCVAGRVIYSEQR